MKEFEKYEVSIIIIFYNAGKFINEAIQSVINQSYINWELLLIDDGSVDQSTSIAKEYSIKYEKIFYFEHEEHSNRGMSASRNLGIQNAKNEWIAFLDADDVWLPDKLSEQLAIVKLLPDIDLIYGNTIEWYSWDKSLNIKDQIHDRHYITNEIIYPPLLLYKNRPFGQFSQPLPSGILIKKTLIDKVGGFEEQFKSWNDDLAFFLKVYLSGKTFIANKVWLKYRKHDCSQTQQIIEKGELTIKNLLALKWFKSYIKEKQIDSEIRVLLKRQILFLKLRYLLETIGLLDVKLVISNTIFGKFLKKYTTTNTNI